MLTECLCVSVTSPLAPAVSICSCSLTLTAFHLQRDECLSDLFLRPPQKPHLLCSASKRRQEHSQKYSQERRRASAPKAARVSCQSGWKKCCPWSFMWKLRETLYNSLEIPPLVNASCSQLGSQWHFCVFHWDRILMCSADWPERRTIVLPQPLKS